MKILMVNVPTALTNEGHKRRADTFPMGLLYVAGALIKDGHKVSLFDILAEDLTQNEVINRLREYKSARFDFVGISAMSTQYIYVKWLSAQIKEILGDIPIVVGGAAGIHSPHVVLKNTKADYCVIGEGEPAMVALVNASNPRTVGGLAYKDGETVVTTSHLEQLPVDDIPLPAYQLLNFDLYRPAMQYDHVFKDGREEKLRWVCVCSARGCPYACKFCSLNFPGYRARSMESVEEEIGVLKTLVEFNYVIFTDELPLISKKRTDQIGDSMKKMGLYWSASARANILTPELVKSIYESGCVSLSIGIESGSQRLLDAMKKKNNVPHVKKILTAMYDTGVLPSSQLLFGYPGEDDESIEETYQLFDGLPCTNAGFYFVTPFPGSPLYDEAIAAGLIENEDEYLSLCESGTQDIRINFTQWSDEELRQKRDLLTKRLYYNGLKARYGVDWVKQQIDRAYIEKDIGAKYTSMILDGPDDGGTEPAPIPVAGSETKPLLHRFGNIIKSATKTTLGRSFFQQQDV